MADGAAAAQPPVEEAVPATVGSPPRSARTLWREAARHARAAAATSPEAVWVTDDAPDEPCVRFDYDAGARERRPPVPAYLTAHSGESSPFRIARDGHSARSSRPRLSSPSAPLHYKRPTRSCARAAHGTWSRTETVCRMEAKPFAAGAMRECYRLLKQTQQPNTSDAYRHDWRHASRYVAKRYKTAAGTTATYCRDCVMQMESKLWGDAFNRAHPPKQVDFLACFLLQLPDRPGQPLFACERVIDGARAAPLPGPRIQPASTVLVHAAGEYIKHNNNSGFVEEHHRSTPQAFSHFTFQARAPLPLFSRRAGGTEAI